MKKIKLIFTLLINIIFYALGNIIPKDKSVWVFSAWFGQKYNDNPKAFFEYVNKHHKQKIKVVWISKNIDVISEVRQLGYIAYHEKSLSGIWHQLRASKVIICQSLHDDLFAPCIGKKTKVIQLWHGIPLKKIMFDAFADKKEQKNIFGQFVDYLSPYNEHRNDLVISTSELTQATLAQAFRLDKVQVLTSGFPRNDVFFEHIEKSKNVPFKCIYMPTFRGGIASECDLFERYGFDFKAIESQLIKHNIQLTLRMHPVNKPPVQIVEEIKNSTVIKLDAGSDIYQSISQYDCLITDYSSIYFDFLLSNKPIIFAPFDLDEYKNRERSLYFEFEDVTLKPYCYSWNEILERLISLKEHPVDDEYKSEYSALKDKFHEKPIDGKSPFSAKLFSHLDSQ
ncbi:CDP-glycerol glycerophosphotransferase family protein [Pseudocolwellia sp. HL-MZ7]|uniref:CDP-glycerol glycerophosphotransferase family protein n=1 Tax=Pseudocolwellia sp. HL-MZ7 TaxID=3400627 RepID=UPI003CF9E787